ncbi:G-protein coupled receptor 1 [Electrophorus electricus]|uniref:G-protein coupled receptors family 1 profile domain-containing protein n=1 Tax=Electrophorus electricus TaxID=8005 RepID=A0A4W4FEQ1_ELEEL|nr:G-protein coupled receptor 1 [Electrophorus electricus]XP_026873838.2 G-protein coupled receptor 1 [Electrophorus electricus]
MDVEAVDYDNYTYQYLEDGDLFDTGADSYIQKETLHIISVVIYTLAFVLGVFGNGIVIWVTAFKIKRTVNSVWVQNLAMADFVFVLFLPFSIDYVLRDFNWVFGRNMCKLNAFVCTMNMYASVLFLTVLSVDRYISLVHFVWSRRERTVPRAWAVCALIWVSAVFLSVPTLVFRETMQYHGKVMCFNNFHDENIPVAMVRHMTMVALRTTVGFFLPFLTITVTAMLLAMKMRQLGIQHVSSFSRMVLAIILAFFLCWAPFHIFCLMELSTYHFYTLHLVLAVGFPLATSLGFFNSCVNPVLYVLLNKNVRSIIRRSCMNIAKNSLRELNHNVSDTESVSALASCPPEDLTVCSRV